MSNEISSAWNAIKTAFARMEAVRSQIITVHLGMKEAPDKETVSAMLSRQKELEVEWDKAYRDYIDSCSRYRNGG